MQSITSVSNTSIEVVVDDIAAGSGDAYIVLSSGAYVQGGDWEYLERGAISNVEPESGVWGTRVTITGDRLLGGGASIDRAWLAGVEATIVDAAEYQNTYDAGTELRLVARNSSAQAGDIVLLADTGAVVAKNAGWVY